MLVCSISMCACILYSMRGCCPQMSPFFAGARLESPRLLFSTPESSLCVFVLKPIATNEEKLFSERYTCNSIE